MFKLIFIVDLWYCGIVMVTRFHGVITPFITPFKEDLSIDIDAIQWLVNYQIEGGVHGVFPNSTTGEFVHLSREESILIVKTVLDEVNDRIWVIPGISANSTLHCIELGRIFMDMGVNGIIVTPPYFFKPSYDNLKMHFSMIAEKIDLPIIIYNIPSTTGVNIPVKMYMELSLEHDNIVGAKVTYDSFTYLRNLILDVKSLRSDFSVLTGLDDMFLPTLMMGGDGGIMALANATPKLHRAIYDCWINGDIKSAYDYWMILLRLVKVYDYASSFPTAVKTLLKIMNKPVKTFVRPPLTPEKNEVENKIKSILNELKSYQFLL